MSARERAGVDLFLTAIAYVAAASPMAFSPTLALLAALGARPVLGVFIHPRASAARVRTATTAVRPRPGWVIAVAAVVVVGLAASALAGAISTLPPGQARSLSPGAVVLVAVSEELLRVRLAVVVARLVLGERPLGQGLPLWSLLAATAVWVSLHAGYGAPALGAVAVIGVALSLVVRATGSVLPAIAAHGFYDAIASAINAATWS